MNSLRFFSRLSSSIVHHSCTVTVTTRRALSFAPGPAPPRLSEAEQKIYEELQRNSTGAFSTPISAREDAETAEELEPQAGRTRLPVNQSLHNEYGQEQQRVEARVQAEGKGEELHPDIRKGARPEFEGERNPKTGEVGGPKNEPLRWGGGVDWSYNGRVTDF